MLVDVIPPRMFSGGVIDGRGGPVQGAGGIELRFPAGAVESLAAVEIRTLDPDSYSAVVMEAGVAVRAFELNVGGLVPGTVLPSMFRGLLPARQFVLARVLTSDGVFGLQPVERLLSDGTGVSLSQETGTPPRLPGVRGAGQYVLVQLDTPQGLVTGTATTDAGAVTPGLIVTVTGQPWLARSGDTGRYTGIPEVASLVCWQSDFPAVLSGIAGSGNKPVAGLHAKKGLQCRR